ncbi:hypothetical protein [uncultured Fibrobacter sp.]|uniref:hypothetical protein n=1 Tax=uncultured Fibrobacter sp. TaxID=261512 RepID=UPI00262F1810|nr:hypothetical protein [uncultured Fibrobacter sp.]
MVFLAIYLGRSPKVRGWLKVLSRNRRIWRTLIATVLILATITLTYVFLPAANREDTDERKLFERYAAEAVLKLDTLQKIAVDSSCDLTHAEPELAYVLPLVIAAYNEIVEKPTLPIITRLDDTLHFTMNGYKQFKNRGIRLNKLLQKKLGNRYTTKITSEETTHTLEITYNGNPWDTEQLTALPVMEASRIYKLDPALLMSLIRHVSNFNFDFRGQKDAHGILALEEGEGLEQIFIGADRLSKQLRVGISQENAIATFYPEPEIGAKPENWHKSPLTKSWVDQVLSDIQFYRANGLK